MKIRLFLLISAMVVSLAEVFAFDLNVSEPGSFKDLLIDTEADISTLRLSGTLNAADVEYLTGNSGKIMQVKHLDITDVKLVESETEPYRKVTIFAEAGGGTYAKFYYSKNKREEVSTSTGGLGMPVAVYSIYGDDLAGLLANTEFEKVTLPAKDNRIADYICFKSMGLKEAVLPDNVEEIGESCFEDCFGLASVNMPSALKKIGSNAFYRTVLTSVTLPAHPVAIGDRAFWRVESLSSINLENVNAIGDEAFKATALSSADLSNVEKISSAAFMDCPISELKLSANLREIGDRAFYLENWSLREKVKLTELIFPEGTESIGASAFEGTALSKVEIPVSISFIGDRAFKDTPWDMSLNTAAIDGVVYLGNVAYKAVNKPKDVVFRDGTVSVAANFDMSSVRSFTLPSSVVSLYAAGGNYENLESATLNDGLRIIGDNVFYSSPKLTSIEIPSTVEYIGDNAFCMSGITSLKLPEGLKVIKSSGQNEFYSTFGNTKITSVTLPASLEEIGGTAFMGCPYLSTVRLDSRRLDYGDYIGSYVPFSGCNIEKLVIGAGVENIPDGLFSIGGSLAHVEFEDSDVPLEIGNKAIWAYDDNPAKVKGSIDRVVSLGDEAFSGLEFPFGTKLSLPNMKHLGDRALYNVSGVIEMDLHSGIESLPEYLPVCESMPDLRKVIFDIPNLKRVPQYDYVYPLISLHYENALDSLVIGKNVEVIPESLFESSRINTVVFAPRPQTRAASSLSIGKNAFSNNSNLYCVEFPAGLTSLGESAFNGCDQLSTVYFHGAEAPAAGSNAIQRTATVYVPADAESEYRSAMSGNNVVPYRIESVMLDKSALGLNVNGADYLIARIAPAECSEMGIEWSTSDPSVATVSTRGDVIGVAPGNAVITATIALAPEFKAECLVTVTDPNGVEGVEDVSGAPVVAYYTLEGTRIEKPSAPGIYVAVHADGTKSKVMLK